MELTRLDRIASEAILTETRAPTTQEEAILVRSLQQARGVRAIPLVTNAQHMLQARPLFEPAAFHVHATPSNTLSAPDAPRGRVWALMRGIVKHLLG